MIRVWHIPGYPADAGLTNKLAEPSRTPSLTNTEWKPMLPRIILACILTIILYLSGFAGAWADSCSQDCPKVPGEKHCSRTCPEPGEPKKTKCFPVCDSFKANCVCGCPDGSSTC